MIRRPPRSTQGVSSAASDVYKRQRYNTLNIMKLLNIFTEEEIILGLDIATRKVYKNFYTLSYLVSFLKREFQTKNGSNEINTKYVDNI